MQFATVQLSFSFEELGDVNLNLTAAEMKQPVRNVMKENRKEYTSWTPVTLL